MLSFCHPKILYKHCFQFLLQRNWRQCLCKILGWQTKSVMVCYGIFWSGQLSMSAFLYWCSIWIFVQHSFSLYLGIEALLLSYFTKFYDHLETLLLNLHNVSLTKKSNLLFKQFGSQLTLIFRCKSKQDNDY